MTREELERAIEETKHQIYQVKEQLDRVSDLRAEKQLLVRMKELQVRQIWYVDQLEAW